MSKIEIPRRFGPDEPGERGFIRVFDAGSTVLVSLGAALGAQMDVQFDVSQPEQFERVGQLFLDLAATLRERQAIND